MFRRLVPLALLVLVLSFAQSAKADIIYDAITGQTFSFTGSLPRSHEGDPANNIAANPGFMWRVDQIDMNFVVGAAGTFNDVTCRIRVWDTWNPGNAANVFADLLSDITWSFGTVTTTGVSGFGVALPYDSFKFDIADTQFAIDIDWRVGGLANDNFTTGISNSAAVTPPAVGSTALEGYYRDVANNGVFESSDARDLTNLHTNLMVRVHGYQVVPEPSLGLFGLAAIAAMLIAPRRRGA